jgi:hypothetical protein
LSTKPKSLAVSAVIKKSRSSASSIFCLGLSALVYDR